ncbi:MAG: TIGR01212 family radical SAM protein [Prevotella sp.]|nr:TIGR01212 family radical SAM protein [Bacteroides sp.]MCM1367032.1 TIGR01212 family radical SAM protein [Prevotella sp.]MCM1437508.1 TIGR01212 family radical SAM protein [Prevotella sp.]
MNPWYKDYSEYLAEKFPGLKVQKISIDAGFTCPNRDGTISHGGCIYCNNKSFSPSYCSAEKSPEQQLAEGKNFFSRKYPSMKYLAYFQAYTGTFSSDTKHLLSLYHRALKVADVVGLVIGTRPDCLHSQLIKELSEINKTYPVFIELGAETSNNQTLKLINRGHKWDDTVAAVNLCRYNNLDVGLHLIAGLPGENIDDILKTIDLVSRLPIQSIKLHQLQIIRDTPLERLVNSGVLKVELFSVEDYLNLCLEIVKRIPRSIAIERFVSQAPANLLVAPKWGLKNYEFTNRLHNNLKKISSQKP